MRALLLLALAAPAHAQLVPFAEIGAGAALGGCIYQDRVAVRPSADPVRCSRSPLAVLALGVRSGRWSLQWEHWSAPAQDDRGIEMVTLRYRIELR